KAGRKRGAGCELRRGFGWKFDRNIRATVRRIQRRHDASYNRWLGFLAAAFKTPAATHARHDHWFANLHAATLDRGLLRQGEGGNAGENRENEERCEQNRQA